MQEEGERLTVCLIGRLDTVTSGELSEALAGKEPKELIIDPTDLEYISSARLRVLLTAQKGADERDGTLVVRNPNPVVRNVFQITGFNQNITIE